MLTPCVYAPQGKWDVQPISYLEALVCKDMSETLAKVLVQLPAASDAIRRGFTSGKCLVAGVRALFQDSGECEVGQGSGIGRARGSGGGGR